MEAEEQTELAILLERAITYFRNRASRDDVDVLCFSLQHLFCNIDILYQEALPGLSEQVASAIERPTENLSSHPHIWLQLQTVRRALERMEVLCHLFTGALTNILDALATPICTASTTQVCTENITMQVATEKVDPEPNVAQERWERAFTTLKQHLNQWQQYHRKHPSLSIQFSHLIPTIPSLIQIDAAFDLLLESAKALFGNILPGFQAISTGDDEAVATLLFDLMQQADLLLVYSVPLLEPLHTLIRHSTPVTEMN